ncbi:EpsG family protein [Bacillus cereus]|nr:EpsG family protein [Bacillus cereus]
MTIIWLTLLMVFIFSYTARYFAASLPHSPISIRPNRLLVAAVCFVIVMVAGLRKNIGDTFFYMHAYALKNFTWATIATEKDVGFNLFQMLLKQISEDPQILIFVTALITNVLIVLVMHRYARLFELAMYVYITSGAFIVSMNGIRQYMAAALLFAATAYLLNGSWKRYMVVVALASVFHMSALILIPLYFIVRREAWTGMTFGLLAAGVLIVGLFNQFSDLLFSALSETQYGEYKEFKEGGANIIRVGFYMMPLLVAYWGRDKLRMLFADIDIIVNLSLIGSFFMLISTQNWIFARLAIYFNLYQIVLTSWIVMAFRKKDQKLIYLCILVIYGIYFTYENMFVLGIMYRSDFLIWFH